MKIAIITPYENSTGGVETVTNILIQIFKSSGWQVDLITTDNFKPSLMDWIFIKLIGLPYITSRRYKATAIKYDVVICNGEFGYGVHHPKAINLFHGSYKGLRDYLKDQYTLAQYFGLTKAMMIQRISAKEKYVVTVSEFIKKILEDDNIFVDKVITNCVNTDVFKPEVNITKNNRLLFVGSYNYLAKGFDVLQELADAGYQIDCVTDTNPGEKMGWIKNVPNDRMSAIYNEYKILIFPSRFEGAAMVPLEAMACGLPVVMSNIGLGPEIRNKMPEFVVDDNRSEMYIKKIEHIINDYGYYAKKAREYILVTHTYDDYKNKWLRLVEEIHALGN